MLIVNIEGKQTIDAALKKLKSKYIKTGLQKELFSRREFKKKSVLKREIISKAKYLEKIKTRDI